MVMDKVDLSPRKSEMTLHVKIINLPPPAAGGAAAGATQSPTDLPAAHAPAEESEEEEERTAAVTASRSLRKSTRQTKLVEKGAAVTMKTLAVMRVPMQTPAAKRVRHKRSPSKVAASNVTKKAAVQKRAAKPSAKWGGRRQTWGAKGTSTTKASPSLSVDEKTHFDEEPDDSTAAQALALLARGGRFVRPLSPPVVETPRIGEQGLLAKQVADVTGGGSVHPNPGPSGFVGGFVGQPMVSQPVHPAGRGAGGVTGELQEGNNARILASSTLEIMMAEISSLKLALAQRGTIAPEVRYFREAWGWGKCACVHGIADGMEKDSVGTPHGTVPWNTSATRGRTMEHGGYYQLR